jgi:hypothetical protein
MATHNHIDVSKADFQHVDESNEKPGAISSTLADTTPKDGDLGGRWLATYTGSRPELTDEANNKIRNRIDIYLLPLIFLIYFNQQLDKSAVSFVSQMMEGGDAYITTPSIR